MIRWVAIIAIAAGCGVAAGKVAPQPADSFAPQIVATATTPVLVVDAETADTAQRVAPPSTLPPVVLIPAEVATGLNGLPFAPDGLSDCQEMQFYRLQWGLPERFQALGWRESNCRNEEGVHTYCCYGYLQLYFTLHISDHRMAPKYAACGVDEISDYNGDEPLDKQKQMCVAAALYQTVGMSPWAL